MASPMMPAPITITSAALGGGLIEDAAEAAAMRLLALSERGEPLEEDVVQRAVRGDEAGVGSDARAPIVERTPASIGYPPTGGHHQRVRRADVPALARVARSHVRVRAALGHPRALQARAALGVDFPRVDRLERAFEVGRAVRSRRDEARL